MDNCGRGEITAAVVFTLVLLVLTGCGALSTGGIYRAYVGLEPTESELATLELGAAQEAIIDDRYYVSRAKYPSVKLVPGLHKITWETAFGVSVMVDPKGYAAFGIVSRVTFEPGHVYRLSGFYRRGFGIEPIIADLDLGLGLIAAAREPISFVGSNRRFVERHGSRDSGIRPLPNN